jgi:hypothetical protein
MAKSTDKIAVYLEVGQKRTFAGTLDWPGWCRRGHDERAALQALLEAAPRYAGVLRGTRLGFRAPGDLSVFSVVERLEGNATTDFGAPNIPPSADAQPFGESDAKRCGALLRAIWRAFDGAIEHARGKELSKGPRGGGRDLDRIVDHVLGADAGYLSSFAHKVPKEAKVDRQRQIDRTREVILEALEAGARGEIPERGPRGGKIWTPRYYVRRSAWHTLDHAWEIEDRIIS